MAHVYDNTIFTTRQTNRTAAQNAITRLTQIINQVEGATLAQTQTAVKDVATYERAIIRLIVSDS